MNPLLNLLLIFVLGLPVVAGQTTLQGKPKTAESESRSAVTPSTVKRPEPPPATLVDEQELPSPLQEIYGDVLLLGGTNINGNPSAADHGLPFIHSISGLLGEEGGNHFQLLHRADAVAVHCENLDDAPLLIASAEVRTLPSYRPSPSMASPSIPFSSIVRLGIRLVNRANQAIESVLLRFDNSDGRLLAYLESTPVSLSPGNSMMLGEGQAYNARFTCPLEELRLTVSGVVFEDGTVWKIESSPIGAERLESAPRLVEGTQIDTDELPEGESEGGIVVLRVGGNADGSVRHVEVLRGVSENLDKEAVRRAKALRFRPTPEAGESDENADSFSARIFIEFGRRLGETGHR